MRAQELIARKRDGGELAPAELRALVAGITDGSVPDYQAAAFLMAVFFRGMTPAELAAWADAMLRSGDVLDLSAIAARKVDKHSTGGVGDKISLPLAPAVAACGVAVPMVSGRGLGHTGGTLDKLEAIPGFSVNLPVERFRAQVAELGVCMIGQTERIAPADRKLYALRDVTATVESIPLIASSIMSKKRAEGIDALVLDQKVGAGAFMKRIEDARALARTIIAIGRAAGKRVTALITAMDQPIGRAVGNASEVEESIETLRGRGPADTRELTVALGAEMLVLGGAAADSAAGRARIEAVLDGGQALERFARMIAAQGGDARVCEDTGRLPQARTRREVVATAAGVVEAIDAEAVGVAAMMLGAGRRTKEDRIDPAVGIDVLKKVGDRVAAGEPLALLRVNDAAQADAAAARYLGAVRIGAGAGAAALRGAVLEVLRDGDGGGP
ncbi:MAG: thymidine phosphorylase [Deltaproteobacteria bacterium]|nr:thymidine phosphorylase [Deltaproteobacteria bacterium]